MTLIERYLFRQLLVPTVLALLALTAVAFLSQSLSALDLIVDQRQSLGVFLRVSALAMPELVADDLTAYEDMAVQLAGQPERIAQFKQTLAANRYIKPLFDAERFTHHLETAFEMMAAHARQGLPPDHIDVPALPVRLEPFMEEDQNAAAIAAE